MALTLILVKPNQLDELTLIILILFGIVELAAFFFWIFKLSIFNFEKEYGDRQRFLSRSALEVIIFFLCAILILSPSAVVTTTAIYKTAYVLKIDKTTNCIKDGKTKETNKSSSLRKQFLSDKELEEWVSDDLNDRYNDKGAKATDMCSGVQDFLTSTSFDKHNDILPYQLSFSIQLTFLSFIAFPLLLGRYGKIRTLSYSVLYILILVVINVTVLALRDSIGLSSDENSNLIFSLILSAIFISTHSIILSRSRKYNFLLPVNFIVLSIVTHALSLAIYSQYSNEEYEALSLILILPLGLMICIFPFLKKILIRNLSLPE
ncbi:MAG: hypothetical protein KME07_08880 [Pegethrix bostrychoides GSE-TBD4-15B]|jgi:hypothetical protein|uniref:Uncharacterized protein n=1 Tax=Pegethrix bostrychoides GSE-TBD4-15B TaxID=2839662 RepID=A0A951U4L5_9CYAN|nr:hypothetical protein [Pegethrix bostrychoides GSE-TBD4-15B]